MSLVSPRSRLLRLVVLGLALGGAPRPDLAAQSAPAAGRVLTLDEALGLARQNNPALQSARNARRTAAAAVRAATGAFLPNLNTGFGGGYREGRQTFFQGQGFGSTNDQLSTDVNAQASLQLSLGTLNDRRAARASQEATEADITVAEQTLRANVTTQYLAALQAAARAALQDTLLATTAAQLQLARARLQVGSATQLDVQRAEVADGQQQVAALNQRNQAAIEVLRLFQQIGVAPEPGVRLDPALPEAPAVELPALLDRAMQGNPQLEAFRAREESARRQQASARASYFPTLSLSAGVSAFTNRFTSTGALLDNNLATCTALTFSPAMEAAVVAQQGKYPFEFTRNPYSVNASLSLPLFNGFRREQQVEQAAVQRRNAENDVRAQALRVTADVTAAHLSLVTARQSVVLQEQTVRTARTALALAQERYRVGAISLVDLLQARGDFERAETDRISAVFDVQRAFTALENAVGRPLR
jgi:outer membrane protein